MQFDISFLKTKNENDLYSLLLEPIYKIMEKYKFLDIPKDEFNKLIMESLKERLENIDNYKYKTKILNEDYFLIKIERNITRYLEPKIKENAFWVLDSFINQNIEEVSTYKDALVSISKFKAFLDFHNIVPYEECLERLIKDNFKLNKVLEIIVNHNLENIKINKLPSRFANDFIYTTLIEIYCKIYNIKINYQEEDSKGKAEYKKLEEDMLKIYLNELNYPILSYEEEKKFIS